MTDVTFLLSTEQRKNDEKEGKDERIEKNNEGIDPRETKMAPRIIWKPFA